MTDEDGMKCAFFAEAMQRDTLLAVSLLIGYCTDLTPKMLDDLAAMMRVWPDDGSLDEERANMLRLGELLIEASK